MDLAKLITFISIASTSIVYEKFAAIVSVRSDLVHECNFEIEINFNAVDK